jgi:hypothetical protein
LHEDVIDVALQARLVDAETGRGIPLRIRVDDQNALAQHGECRAEIDGRRAFADAALLIDERDDATQDISPKESLRAGVAGVGIEILLEKP